MLRKNYVVQFTEGHKWCGCLGIVNEVKDYGDDIRYMVGVPMPQQGTAYIFVMESENAIESIGPAVMVVSESEQEDSE